MSLKLFAKSRFLQIQCAPRHLLIGNSIMHSLRRILVTVSLVSVIGVIYYICTFKSNNIEPLAITLGASRHRIFTISEVKNGDSISCKEYIIKNVSNCDINCILLKRSCTCVSLTIRDINSNTINDIKPDSSFLLQPLKTYSVTLKTRLSPQPHKYTSKAVVEIRYSNLKGYVNLDDVCAVIPDFECTPSVLEFGRKAITSQDYIEARLIVYKRGDVINVKDINDFIFMQPNDIFNRISVTPHGVTRSSEDGSIALVELNARFYFDKNKISNIPTKSKYHTIYIVNQHSSANALMIPIRISL